MKVLMFLLGILATANLAQGTVKARDLSGRRYAPLTAQVFSKPADWLPHLVCQSPHHCLEVIEIRYPESRPLKGVALLIPGFTQNARFWDLWPEHRISYARHLMDELGVKVYLLNVNGIGNSDRTRQGNMDNIAIDDIPAALEYVAAKEQQKVLIAGHSQGGITLLASLSGLTRNAQGLPEFSRAVAEQRQSLVRGALAIASNVTMRSELPWTSLFRRVIHTLYRLRGFLAQHFDGLKPSSLGGAFFQNLVRVPQWGAWDFLYSVKRLSPELRRRIHRDSVDGTSSGILNQFTAAMVANRADQGVQAARGPYYWEGLNNLIDVKIATVFFEDDSMARPRAGLEDTFLRIPARLKYYRALPDQRHEDFAFIPELHAELDDVLSALLQ